MAALPDDECWACPVCTLLNPVGVAICNACGESLQIASVSSSAPVQELHSQGTLDHCRAAVQRLWTAAALKALLMILGNVVDNPDDPKFRGPLRKANGRIRDSIVAVAGAAEVLHLAGFEEDDESFMMKFLDLQRLSQIRGLLQEQEKLVLRNGHQVREPNLVSRKDKKAQEEQQRALKAETDRAAELALAASQKDADVEPRNLRLRFALPLGGRMELTVETSMTTSGLRSLVLERTGIPNEHQKMLFGFPRKMLKADDDSTLIDIGMHDGEVVILENLQDLWLGNLELGNSMMEELIERLPPSSDDGGANVGLLFRDALDAFGIGLKDRNFWGHVYARVRRLVAGEVRDPREKAQIKRGLLLLRRLFHNHDPRVRLSLVAHCMQIPCRRGMRTQITVDRSAFLRTVAPEILNFGPEQMRSPLHIWYVGEQGLDAGGLTRDFFSSFATRLGEDEPLLWGLTGRGTLHPTADIVAAEARYTSRSGWRWINADQLYRACGRVFGMAVLHGCKLGRPLSHSFIRVLTGDPPQSLDDLQAQLNREAGEGEQDFRGKKQILEEPLADLGLDGVLFFSRTISNRPDLGEIELVPGGAKIEVTDENKEAWLTLSLRHELVTSIEFAAAAFREGLIDVFSGSSDACPLLCLLGPDELIELWGKGGVERHEVAPWRAVSRVSRAIEMQAVWFWKALEEDYDDETRGKVLQFATGSSSIGRGGLRAFFIEPADGGDERLPSAMTCGNMIQLPRYSCYPVLSARVRTAAEMCSNFMMM